MKKAVKALNVFNVIFAVLSIIVGAAFVALGVIFVMGGDLANQIWDYIKQFATENNINFTYESAAALVTPLFVTGGTTLLIAILSLILGGNMVRTVNKDRGNIALGIFGLFLTWLPLGIVYLVYAAKTNSKNETIAEAEAERAAQAAKLPEVGSYIVTTMDLKVKDHLIGAGSKGLVVDMEGDIVKAKFSALGEDIVVRLVPARYKKAE